MDDERSHPRWCGRSVDVEHGLAADAAVQECLDRDSGFAPGIFELNLAVEATVGDKRAQTVEVTGSAGVRSRLVELVQGIDARAGRPVEKPARGR